MLTLIPFLTLNNFMNSRRQFIQTTGIITSGMLLKQSGPLHLGEMILKVKDLRFQKENLPAKP